MISDRLALVVSGLIQVSDMVKRSVSSEINFAMAGYLLFTDLMFAEVTWRQLGGPGFGLISPASRSRMKRREGDRAGGINTEDLMLKCGGRGFEGAETNNIRTLNAIVNVVLICSNKWLDCQ